MATHQRGHIPVVRVTEEAWGEDSDEEKAVAKPSKGVKAAPRKATPARLPLDQYKPLPRGAPNLQTMCLGVLALYIEEVMEGAADVAPWLQPEERATLLAVARRRGAVDDAVLMAMADEDWRVLDLEGCEQVTDAGLLEVLPRLPLLQAVNLTGCCVTAGTLQNLASWCPNLEILRLGRQGSGEEGVGRALQSLVPTVAQTSIFSVGESWEEVADGRLPGNVEGRLTELRQIEWVSASHKSIERLRGMSPRLKVNEGPYPLKPLDKPHVEPIMQLEWARDMDWGTATQAEGVPGSDAGPELLPLAERFRMAYESRNARLAVVTERNRRRAARRALLRSSPAEMAIRLAEWGVPLTRVKR